MLEVGRVEASRGEHDVDAARVDVVEHGAQTSAVVAVVDERGAQERRGIAAPAELAGDEGIRGARGDAEVVLENEPLVVLPLDQVDARDVTVDSLRRDDTLALGQVAGAHEGEVLGHNPLANRLLGTIEVTKVRIERVDALGKPLREIVPGRGLDRARNGIEREEPLVEGPVLVQAELNAVARELLVDLGRMFEELIVGWHRPTPYRCG